MKRELYVAAVAIALFFSGMMYSCNSKAGDLTVGDFVSADDVLKETRTFRQAVGAFGAVWGGSVGYAAATAAGANPVGVAVVTIATGVMYGAAMYGASTLGVEVVIQSTAAEARKRHAEIAEELKSKAKSLQKNLNVI